MKKHYSLLLISLIGFVGNAQIVNIPDANFKTKLLASSTTANIAYNAAGTKIKIDTNNNGEIEYTEALVVARLIVGAANISDLTGVESFTNITLLNCANNPLTQLNITQNVNLTLLAADQCQLTSLTVSAANASLQRIDCQINQLTQLDTSSCANLQFLSCYNNLLTNLTTNNNLKELGCSSNQLTNLSLQNYNNLTKLVFTNNNITSLDLNTCPALESLSADNNNLSSLDVSNNLNLNFLRIKGNELTTIDISQNSLLSFFDCSDNLFQSIDVSQNLILDSLYFNSNQLTSIDVSHNTLLGALYCDNNMITNIDMTHNLTLQVLYCQNNQIELIDLSNNKDLFYLSCGSTYLKGLLLKSGTTLVNLSLDIANSPNLEYICIDTNRIDYIENVILPNYTYNCHVNDYCSFTPGGTFYSIQGNTTFDSDNNGCNISDSIIPFQKFTITNGTETGSIVSNEDYFIAVQSGNHTITPVIENPTYFNVLPSSLTVSFPASTSPFNQNFCISPNGIHNDVEISIIPLELVRPGFNAYFKIIYKNKGNQISNGSLSLTYNDDLMDSYFTNPVNDNYSLGQLDWNYSNLLPFESREILANFYINSPIGANPVNGGDILSFTTTINGPTDDIPGDNTFTLHQTVVNSFDPNDKTCLEGNTISPSMVGQYVHYIIRFENTGTANAENIVVKDMIDTTKFDVNSLIPLSGSHPYVTRISSTNDTAPSSEVQRHCLRM